jgi:hypothetical protein
VFNPQRQLADHARPARYQMRLPSAPEAAPGRRDDLYVLRPSPRRERSAEPDAVTG